MRRNLRGVILFCFVLCVLSFSRECHSEQIRLAELSKICIETDADQQKVLSTAESMGWLGFPSTSGFSILNEFGIHPSMTRRIKRFENDDLLLSVSESTNENFHARTKSCRVVGDSSSFSKIEVELKNYFSGDVSASDHGVLRWVYVVNATGERRLLHGEEINDLREYIKARNVYIIALSIINEKSGIIFKVISKDGADR
jgi:hypothetical protein